MKSFKAGNVEAVFAFEQQIEEVTAGASTIPSLLPLPQVTNRQRELASINPRMAITQSWADIEHQLARAVLARSGDASPAPSIGGPITNIRRLSELGHLQPSEVSLLHELNGLRNQVAHIEDFEPSYESALQYIDLASRIQKKLEDLTKLDLSDQ